MPFGDYDSPTLMSTVCGLLFDEDNDLHNDLVARIHKYNGFSFDPTFHDIEMLEGSLVNHSLLKSTDSTTYTGHEFKYRKVATTSWVKVLLGEDIYKVEVTSYGYEYMSNLMEGELLPILHDPHMHHRVSYTPDHPTSQQNYEDIKYQDVDVVDIATISPVHGRQEGEPEGVWDSMLHYLKDNILPEF